MGSYVLLSTGADNNTKLPAAHLTDYSIYACRHSNVGRPRPQGERVQGSWPTRHHPSPPATTETTATRGWGVKGEDGQGKGGGGEGEQGEGGGGAARQSRGGVASPFFSCFANSQPNGGCAASHRFCEERGRPTAAPRRPPTAKAADGRGGTAGGERRAPCLV